MKITYVIDYLYGLNGGTEKQLFMLIEGMVSRGHEVELYVFTETDFTLGLSEFPCPVHCLGFKSVFSLKGLHKLWEFRQLLVSKKVDVVHGFFNDVALILPPLMMGTGIRTYTSRRDMGIWYTFTNLLLLRFFRFTKTRLICNSQAVARLVQEKEWKPRNSIKVIYNGMERVSVSEADKTDFFPTNETDSAKTIKVILVANIRPVKRIEDLIKAASRLRNAHNPIHYYVVGHLQDKPYCDSLMELLHHYRLEDVFHFVGPLQNPRNSLARFDIGVLTSESEGLSNTIMEYLDAGLPVIASSVGGNPELVADGYNGFLYEVGNVNALAECIYKLACDSEIIRSFAANSREAVNRLDSVTMVERHEGEYANA